QRLGIAGVRILPMTDAAVETWVQLAQDGEWVHFQEYFVHRRTEVAIRAVSGHGIVEAAPPPGLLQASEPADLGVVRASNPFVSIGPILQVAGVREAIIAGRQRRGLIVAGISPLIGGTTVKGPAARMLVELGYDPTAAGAASVYGDLLGVWLIDPVDAA